MKSKRSPPHPHPHRRHQHAHFAASGDWTDPTVVSRTGAENVADAVETTSASSPATRAGCPPPRSLAIDP
eukprot:scaffold1800_cov237-Pinguiococcus_pyrenoidosus.AAC.2